MFKDCSPPFLVSLTDCTPKFFSHVVWVSLTSPLAPMMGSSLGQIAGGTLSAHDWFRNGHWSKTVQSEGTLRLSLEMLRHRLCFYWMWIQNHVALRTIAGNLLTQWGEKLLKNGTNIKENGLILRGKKRKKEIKSSSQNMSAGSSFAWCFTYPWAIQLCELMNSFYCLNLVS